MKETWRWFGPSDPISLSQIRETGASGIVTALHDKAPSEVWSLDDIITHRDTINAAGLDWDVCESIWMSDDIKLSGVSARKDVDVWKDSLANLGKAGIKTVCYNFMPVVDWTRTDLAYPIAGVGRALRFDRIDFATYDICILNRPNAADDYDFATIECALKRFNSMGTDEQDRLEKNIIAGLPGGAAGFSRSQIAQRIARFDGVTNDDMRKNLIDFLREVTPVAEEVGVSLAIHPDDPPFSLFGLPRVVSTTDDLHTILNSVKSPANGITFCTGSLGARADNNVPEMALKFRNYIRFVHLRNVRIEPDGSFHEAEHLSGSTDMIAVLKQLIGLPDHIPFRPDHGHLLDFEATQKHAPGYSYLGRLKGLAEIRGALTALEHSE